MTDMPSWTFLTNHAHVLLCVAREPKLRLRDVAHRVQITERAVQRIIHDLAESGYIIIKKEGRRNVYHLSVGRHLRHPIEAHVTLGDLVSLLHTEDVPPL